MSALVVLGRWDEALVRSAQLETDSVDSAALLSPLVDVHCARGDLSAARELLDYPGLRESEELQARVGALAAESTIRRAEGERRGALETAEEALSARGELGITYLAMKVSFVAALEAAYELDDLGRVQELLDEIEALRPGERPRLLEAHARRFRAKLTGDEAAFSSAVAMFRELGLRFWLGVTLLEHGELAGGGSLIEEARGIFEDLRATPWLERAERANSEARVPA